MADGQLRKNEEILASKHFSTLAGLGITSVFVTCYPPGLRWRLDRVRRSPLLPPLPFPLMFDEKITQDATGKGGAQVTPETGKNSVRELSTTRLKRLQPRNGYDSLRSKDKNTGFA